MLKWLSVVQKFGIYAFKSVGYGKDSGYEENI